MDKLQFTSGPAICGKHMSFTGFPT